MSAIKTISPFEVDNKLKENKQLNIIDVREDDEVRNGMIPGAKHIALGTIPERLNELDHSTEYIMVCRSGKRSEKACEYLQQQGFNVTNMSGGMMLWQGEVQ
ncbi:rhodanese-like domain-containing protein [Fictibacillus aquaticus]|uniref:Rhodanese domain-containing protein n=1 Tax=Fictibacillus aquaticus TaxID=2021314 RepID=A0A235F734_9BACL|nr:rhodanese-like domain-containing protein [Fictibacillus aquaticus]OYD56924.1 hypothetical protein CGZ90_15340 [Fictibacillus aquaticus]